MRYARAMAKITDFGDLFIKTPDRKRMAKWFSEVLDLPTEEWGRMFDAPPGDGGTVLGLHAADSDYFGPSQLPFMINLRVDDLDAMLASLRAAGCTVLDRYDETEQGKFGYVQDPEGAVVELWQPAVDDAG